MAYMAGRHFVCVPTVLSVLLLMACASIRLTLVTSQQVPQVVQAVLAVYNSSSAPVPIPLSVPFGIALDGKGRLYVVDADCACVFSVGAVGSSSAGPLVVYNTSRPALLYPTSVALDSSGALYIADSNNNRVVQLDGKSGQVVHVFNTSRPSLQTPYAVALGSSGSVYVLDSRNSRVVQMDANNVVLRVLNTSNPPLAIPNGIAVGSMGSVYISDTLNDRVVVFLTNGSYLTINASLALPLGVALDSAGSRYLFVTDYGHNRVVQIDLSTNTVVTVYNTTNPSLNDPDGVAVDENGLLYISDTGNKRIVVMVASPYLPNQNGVPSTSTIPIQILFLTVSLIFTATLILG